MKLWGGGLWIFDFFSKYELYHISNTQAVLGRWLSCDCLEGDRVCSGSCSKEASERKLAAGLARLNFPRWFSTRPVGGSTGSLFSDAFPWRLCFTLLGTLRLEVSAGPRLVSSSSFSGVGPRESWPCFSFCFLTSIFAKPSFQETELRLVVRNY